VWKLSKQPTKAGIQTKIGEKILITIKRMGINGEGVGYYHRKAVFIPGAIVDEVVRARVTKVEQTYIQAEIVQLVKESQRRIEPICRVYSQCGGCQLQHMDYKAQLNGKQIILEEAFSRYAGIEHLPMRPIIGMNDPWDYRNKAQLQLRYEKGKVLAGLYAEGSHDLIPAQNCNVHHPTLNRVIESVRAILETYKMPIYDEHRRIGGLRTLVARIAPHSGDVQLTFVSATKDLTLKPEMIDEIIKQNPEIVSVAQNTNTQRSSAVFGDDTKIVWGDDRLLAKLGDLQFELSPRAFFQLNAQQTERMYNIVKEAAQCSGTESVIDAYCGTGTIGLWLADGAKDVRGIETIEEAVQDAKRNAQRSNITNITFHVGRSEQLIPTWIKAGYKPDVIVVDPPRTGCEDTLLQMFLTAKPKRIVYVSCNPSTLAKDCKRLLTNGYTIRWIQPIDMFPQTAQVEAVALLERI
jgi:23S rRNA (uracil1939-C5)-methyltransferase